MSTPVWPRVRDWAARAALVRVPPTAGSRAITAFVSLFVAFAIAKSFRFPAVTAEGVFVGDYASRAAAMAWSILWQSDLARLLVGVLLLRLLLARLKSDLRAWLVLPVLACVVYLLLILQALVAGEPAPLSPYLLQNVLAEAREFAAFFWRDALSALVLCIPLYLLQTSASSRARAAAIAVLLAVILLSGLDAAWFTVSRTEVSAAELKYALASPLDAGKAIRDGWNADLLLPLALPLLGLPLGLIAGALARGRLSVHRVERRISLGPWLYLTLLFGASAPAAPENPRAERFTNNFLARQFGELVARPVLRIAHGATSPVDLAGPDIPPAPSALLVGQVRPRYNVVLILLESTRADAVSSYNAAHDATPFLRRFASESLQVEQMFAVVPRTSAAWVSSVAGIYPTSIGNLRQWSARYPHAGFPSSLARLLQPFGYATAFFTPTRLDFENDDRVIKALGFQTVVAAHDLPRGSETLNSFGYTDGALLPRLGSWLDERQSAGSPFFLTVMTNSGHFPYGTPRGWKKPIHQDSGTLPAAYLNAVAYTDHFVEQAVELLRARNQLDQSLVIVIGDHGEGFLEHGLAWHAGLPYLEGLRIPAIVRLPGAERRSGKIPGLRQQIDLAPTIAEVLGLRPARGEWVGSSLLSEVPADRALFFGTHFDELHLGLLRGHRRYLYHFGRRGTETYDLQRDPGEQHDVTPLANQSEVLTAEARMQHWYDKVRENYATNRL